MTIGLPRAMLYYRHRVLWQTFFKIIGCNVTVSGESNMKTLNDGIKYSIDECCLPVKIFMGHVYSLIGKCDYILIPRIMGYGRKKTVCVRLNALYDIARNTFPEAPVLDYNIDVLRFNTEFFAFVKTGIKLGASPVKAALAYLIARRVQREHDKRECIRQNNLLKASNKLKILIVSHAYNNHDALIGKPVADYIASLGALPVYADIIDRRKSVRVSKKLSSLYWLYNRELTGAIELLRSEIDGIVIITAFPCGPDSLASELIMRKKNEIPTVNIVLDELSNDAGVQTRIESFIDIISARAANKG